jgi:hypothetical protein
MPRLGNAKYHRSQAIYLWSSINLQDKKPKATQPATVTAAAAIEACVRVVLVIAHLIKSVSERIPYSK